MSADSKSLVERFYTEVWNGAAERVAREILHKDLTFRGSLGLSHHGPDGFITYLRSVHAALGNYRCVIEDLITTETRAAARVTFTGTHRGMFFGVAPTGRQITWAGAAFFTIADARIIDIWVLGDVDSVKEQLGAASSASLNAES